LNAPALSRTAARRTFNEARRTFYIDTGPETPAVRGLTATTGKRESAAVVVADAQAEFPAPRGS
jgi:hypothetical protein